MTSASNNGAASASTTKAPALPQWREAVAGAGAGVVSRTIMAPLERLKLLKQLQTSTASSSLNTTMNHQSVWRIFWQVQKEQGWYSFWRGNWPAVLRVAGTASINFTCLDYYKRAVVGPLILRGQSSSSPSTSMSKRAQAFWTSLVAGGLAGATSTTIMYPFEFVRTRLAMDMGRDGVVVATTQTGAANQVAATTATSPPSTPTTPVPRQYQGMIDVAVQITKSDGVVGLYRGYGIALVGGIFYRVLYLGGYDALKHEIAAQQNSTAAAADATSSSSSSSLSWSQRIFAAQTISLTAGTLSYPLDSVRRRMMMQSGNCRPHEPRKYKNSIDCFVKVWRQEGVRGFFLGLGPNLVRSVGGALLLVAYDALRTLL